MKQILSASEMGTRAEALRAAGKSVALVATMGAMHAGQRAVIAAAKAAGQAPVVAIFTNPLQLGSNESPAPYLARRADDLLACAAAGADTVFTPSVDEVFPRSSGTFVTEETISKKLCGISRPNHFRGITTFSAYLFNVIRPHTVYFGQKNIQRAAVVRRMAEELKFPVEIVVVPTVRETDGLAAGVENASMTPNQRRSAVALNQALDKIKAMVEAGATSPDRLIAEATHILAQHRQVRVIYISVVDRVTMDAVRDVTPGRCLAVIAVWVDELRLIDNVLL
jgi:pantoate--beta-alanine ligase